MPAPTLANVVVYALQVAAIAAAGIALPAVFGLAAPRARLLHYRLVLIVAVTLPFAWAVCAPAAADADIRVSVDVVGPVSFGDRRPTVLLPEAIRQYPDDEQRAVACHELVHVRRHDWLKTVADEIVRSLFWFHPAIWWLLDEIELAREQVVDREVVALIGRRRPYLEALVKLARPASRPALGPASSFLEREHLGERVAMLLKEAGMSKPRVIGGLLASTSLVLALAAFVAWALPLEAALRADGAAAASGAAASAAPVEVAAAGAQEAAPQKTPRVKTVNLLSSVKPVYPPEAKAKGIKGVVILEARVDETGTVTDVKVLRSVAGLDQAAVDALKQWRYEPQPMPVVFTVTVRFALDDRP
jgi:TonB family protein